MLKEGYQVLKSTTKGVLTGLGIYTLALMGTEYVAQWGSPKIETLQEAEPYIQEYRKKLGIIDDITIDISITSEKNVVSQSRCVDSLCYELILGPKGHDVSTLKHELYHIADGKNLQWSEVQKYRANPNSESERLKNVLVYFFYDEPKAALYALFE